jgi:hypothetical protein
LQKKRGKYNDVRGFGCGGVRNTKENWKERGFPKGEKTRKLREKLPSFWGFFVY